jgi:hypothetical protein
MLLGIVENKGRAWIPGPDFRTYPNSAIRRGYQTDMAPENLFGIPVMRADIYAGC